MVRSSRSYARLSLTDLVAMRDELQNAINAKAAEERRALEGRMSELQAITTEVVNTIRNRNSRTPRRGRRPAAANERGRHPAKGTKVPPKFRGPGGETWSGRGHTPRWLVDLEKSGKKRDSYLIKR